MSDSPKYSQAQLDRIRRERLERERKAKAAEEANLRKEREEAERKRREDAERRRREEEVRLELQRQLERARSEADVRVKELSRMVDELVGAMTIDDSNRISAAGKALEPRIASATDAAQLKNLRKEADDLSNEVVAAVARKQRDDAERRRIHQMALLDGQLSSIREHLAAHDSAMRSKFDSNGVSAIEAIRRDVDAARSTGDPQQLRPVVEKLASAVAGHLTAVEHRRAEWTLQRQAALRAVQDLACLIDGLSADPVVVRWCNALVSKMSDLVQNAEQAVEDERFGEPVVLLSSAQVEANALIARANEAQLKADQRDYIVGSMVDVLSGMGFVVDAPQEEHPGHPASAYILLAHSASGRGFSVSVPVEGDIMYDAEGFAMESQASDSGTVRTCDEAEEVLEDMKQRLQEAFGIVTGELMWDGKPSTRISKTANELPSGGPTIQLSR